MEPSSRDIRQQLCVNNWLKHRGVGSIIQPTGCGCEKNPVVCLSFSICNHYIYNSN